MLMTITIFGLSLTCVALLAAAAVLTPVSVLALLDAIMDTRIGYLAPAVALCTGTLLLWLLAAGSGWLARGLLFGFSV